MSIHFISGSQRQQGEIVRLDSTLLLGRNTDGEITLEASSSGGGGTSDHGLLTGLGDDDHTQYLLTSGTRELAGPWNANNSITGSAFKGDGSQVTGVISSSYAITASYADNATTPTLVDSASLAETASYAMKADHGALIGLGDDDHTQYVLVAGTRQLSANWNANKAITSSVGFVADRPAETLGFYGTSSWAEKAEDANTATSASYAATSPTPTVVPTASYVETASYAAKGAHGSLSGLASDHHVQYLRTDGTRALSAAWNSTKAISGSAFKADPGAGIVGFHGTSSWAEKVSGLVTSASFAQTALTANSVAGTIDSASWAETASFAELHFKDLEGVNVTTPSDYHILGYTSGIIQHKTRADWQIAAVSHSHTTSDISDYNPTIDIKRQGSTVGTRGGINFIQGNNTAVSASDDSGNDDVDVTIHVNLASTYNINVSNITGSNFKATATTASFNMDAGSRMWHRVGNSASASLASVVWGSGSTPPAIAPTGTIYFQL